MKIVVIGGSGLIGSKLVIKLRAHGHEAIAASPKSGVDTLTGEGLAAALQGASVVVDVSNSPSFEDAAVLTFFETSTRNLLTHEGAEGVGHHVALSVVGTERLSESGYFRAKIAQETDQELSDPLFDRARDAVLRVPQGHRRHLVRRQRGAFATGALPADGCRRRCERRRPDRDGSAGKWHGRDRRPGTVSSGRAGPRALGGTRRSSRGHRRHGGALRRGEGEPQNTHARQDRLARRHSLRNLAQESGHVPAIRAGRGARAWLTEAIGVKP